MNDITSVFEGFDIEALMADPTQIFTMMTFPVALILAATLVLVAIYGYRIFKTTISMTMCIVCGILGSTLVAPLLLTTVDIPLPEGISLSAIVGVVFAAIGLFLGMKLYKVSLFISCAAGSFFIYQPIATMLATTMPNVALLQTPEGIMIVSAICAVLTGVILLLLFKPLYIVITSVGGTALAVALIAISIAPTYPVALYVGLGVGAVLGIFAAKHQFKCDER